MLCPGVGEAQPPSRHHEAHPSKLQPVQRAHCLMVFFVFNCILGRSLLVVGLLLRQAFGGRGSPTRGQASRALIIPDESLMVALPPSLMLWRTGDTTAALDLVPKTAEPVLSPATQTNFLGNIFPPPSSNHFVSITSRFGRRLMAPWGMAQEKDRPW